MNASPARSLAHLPLPLFAAPMGLGGIGLAWREAGTNFGAPALIGEALIGLAAAVWIVVASFHLIRFVKHPDALKGDLRHPIRSAFAGAITIGVMLLAAGLLPYAPAMAAKLWLVSVVIHLLIGVWTVKTLLQAPREASTLMPPLLIPLVGNVVAPVIGAKLGFVALSWGLFGIGALLWVMIQPLLLWRVVIGPAVPAKMRPTLAIFLAPPAIGSVALVNLAGGSTPMSLAVAGFAAFIAAVLVGLARDFANAPFAVSWWGLTFPSAAFALCLLKVAHDTPIAGVSYVAYAALLAATAIIALVSALTLKALLAGHLLQPES